MKIEKKILNSQTKKLDIPVVSDSLHIEETKKLLLQYRDEEMPDWNTPFHYQSEGWATMKYFLQWLESKSIDR